MTISLVGIFLFLAVLMAKYYKPTTSQYGTTPQPSTRQTAPAAPADQNTVPISIPGPNAPTP